MLRWLFGKRAEKPRGPEPELVPNHGAQIGSAHAFVQVPQDQDLSVNGSPVQLESSEYKIDQNHA
ncbi:hypothetical protein [Sphingopyxis sp. PET50]|uniref:hypothetical protein n=1 Tax=Sphingopyxis sp. PET50 TaxID=2976533 RepID=UPI0021B06391|nr:hypothetical protein [Sphingopyxis sp. PET50]